MATKESEYARRLRAMKLMKHGPMARNSFTLWHGILKIAVIPIGPVWMEVEDPRHPYVLVMDDQGNVWRANFPVSPAELRGRDITRQVQAYAAKRRLLGQS